ncbi:MAG: SUMF1/EgtB/PvdO family nonheme iron enzyme [Burkholderiaceae bacterium]|nr:SUMF1/EgtB/PvdO family nonheme iron enzyme [Burkholderiaceae bacterium]
MFRSTLLLFALVCLIGFLSSAGQANAQVSPTEQPAKALERQVPVGQLLWDAHEVSVGSLRRYARATGFLSQAEREAGGFIYEAGWTKKPGWTWQSPYGVPAADNEPAVHLTFSEAQAVCQFFNKRLPTDKEWVDAAYLEQRAAPPKGFMRGKRYAYPSGDSPEGAHCLRGCGSYTGLAPRGSLWQGDGHVAVMTTQRGVNGLWDMGGNVWEWVDSGKGSEAITRSASWWYGPERQKESDVATKPMDTRVAYIGFRCVQKPS